MLRSCDDFHVRCGAGDQSALVSARLYPTPSSLQAWLVLAHGAGAGHDSAFIVDYARAFASLGVATVTFNFPYTERRRRLPDPPATLESCWRAVIAAVRDRAGKTATLVAGGKSMGGRIASQVAADAAVASELAGLVLLGYPLHPPGRPGQRRSAHWPAVHVPALFVQGSRDTFSSPDELRVEVTRFGAPATILIVDGGDHSFKVPRRHPVPQDLVHTNIRAAVTEWISGLARLAS